MTVEYKSDFHAHITNPENTLSLIEKAKRDGISSIGMIGRGVLPLLDETIVADGKKNNINIRFGVEEIFSIDGERKDFIIFDIDPHNPEILKTYGQEAIKQLSLNILKKQINFLGKQGLIVSEYDEISKITIEKLKEGEIYEKAITLCRLVEQNPQNTTLIKELWELHRNEFTQTYKDSSANLTKPTPKFLWWLYFASGKPGYFNQEQDLTETAKMVHEAGGLLIFSPESDDPNEEIKKIMTSRDYIDGVMGWHGDKLFLSKQVIRWLRTKGKIILGGSDYNPLRDGEENQWLLGIGKGEMYISSKRLEREYGKKNED